jgi:predicted secreted Zn-dependent protease
MPIRIAALMALATGATPEEHANPLPPVRISETVEYYPIHGNSIRQIRGQLRQFAPEDMERGHGRTRSRLQVQSTLHQEGDTCSASELQVSVDISMVLPEWRPPARVPEAVHRHWAVAIDRLERHEQGHRTHALEAAHALRDDLSRLPPEADCMGMQLRVDDRLRRAAWKLRMRDRFYDARTGAGLRDDPLDP